MTITIELVALVDIIDEFWEDPEYAFGEVCMDGGCIEKT